MKLNKILFYISLSISIITLIVSYILSFCIIKTDISKFITNILLNVFAGTIVMIATSLVDYFITRRQTLERIMSNINKLIKAFSKIEYLPNNEYYSFNQYCDLYSSDKYTKKELQKMYEKEKNDYKEKNKQQMEKIMDTYIFISEMDLDEFSQLYSRDFDFLFDFKKKKKLKIYHNFFEYIWNLLDEIDLQVYHFNIYKKEFKNYEVNYQKIRDLQNKIFYYEEKDIDSKTDFKAIKLFDEIDVDSIGVNYGLNMKYIVVNKVVVDLKEQFKEIGKLAYLNKNYNPYPNNKKKEVK